jgi:hypothetical protein
MGESITDDGGVKQRMVSVEEALDRLAQRIPSAMMRRSLLPAATDLIEHNKSKIRNLQRTKRFQSETRETMFGTILLQTQITEHQAIMGDNETTRTERKTCFIFHPARWLMTLGLKYGLEAIAVNRNRTWQYSVRSIHVVPDDSLVFKFCATGNINAVRELFKRGEASVSDVDTEGRTPLHVSPPAVSIF